MVRGRRPKDKPDSGGLHSILKLCAALSVLLLCCHWLLHTRTSAPAAKPQLFPFQKQLIQSALQEDTERRISLGIALRGHAGSSSFMGTSHLSQQLAKLPPAEQDPRAKLLLRKGTSKPDPLRLIQQVDIGRVDPENLTEEQEKLLNAALARQARYSIDRVAEARLKRRERARAEKEAKAHMLQDQQSLQGFLSSPTFSAFQDERRQGMRGRGILIAAGGPMQLASAYATLKTLREHLKCALPVELFYNGSAEMDRDTKRMFEVRAWLPHFSSSSMVSGIVLSRSKPST